MRWRLDVCWCRGLPATRRDCASALQTPTPQTATRPDSEIALELLSPEAAPVRGPQPAPVGFCPAPRDAVGRMRTGELVGRTVIMEDTQKIGRIEDLLLDDRCRGVSAAPAPARSPESRWLPRKAGFSPR